MNANIIPKPCCWSFLHHKPFTIKTQLSSHGRGAATTTLLRRLRSPTAAPTTTNNITSKEGNGDDSTTGETNTSPPPLPRAPPAALGIRYQSRSQRKRAKQQQEKDSGSYVAPKSPPKDWEDMTVAEKAVELYVGEKGLLFWLNKFAYASIFIIIGAWILFRFVGPSLGLYQLDAPPLAPTAVFKGGGGS